MEESVNQTETMQETTSDDLDLSIDEVNDSQTESEESYSEATETESTDTETQEDDFSLPIKYNGATENLTREEATILAQKGRNYDKMMERLNALQNDPTRRVFEEQARRSGLTLEEYADRLQQFQEESNITQIANNFKAQNPEVSDEVATQYARAEYQNQINAREQQDAIQRQHAEEIRHQRASEQVEIFMRDYPDVDIAKLPEEVILDINQNGETLLSAYRAYENKQLRIELDRERKNNVNAQKATGNLADSVGNDKGMDDFVDGLFNG